MWTAITGIGAALALLPSLYIAAGLFERPTENWEHIQAYMLKDSALQSLYLVAGTVGCTVIIGVALAWLVTVYDFPLRGFLSWALVLPLAVPPYIAAYTYSSMFSYTGVIQTFMRNKLGWTPDPRYFDIMSMQGAIAIFTLFLFPYVYVIVKAFLEKQSASYMENARLLGRHPFAVFWRVGLPISQSAIVGGASLVAFEVLNDYGVAKYYGISSFTTAIFTTWFGMSDVSSAFRLAALLMLAVTGLFLIERLLRRRRLYSSTTSKVRELRRRRLQGWPAYAACLLGLAIVALSFFIPVAQLAVWAAWTYRDVVNASFIRLVLHTLFISAITIVILMAFAIIAANVSRMRRSPFTMVLSKLLSMGYSMPGAVLSIGVLAVFISLDRKLAGWYGWLGLGENRLVLSMSLAMLVFAYVVRFLAVGYNAVEAGFEKTGTRYSEASRLLGFGMTRTFFKVDLPLIKGAVLAGCILTFMEIVKELPLTLLLRPFNFETLATKAYQYASDEQIHQASVPSLLIIGIGILSVAFYHRLGEKKSS